MISHSLVKVEKKKIKLCFNQVLWHKNQPPKPKSTYKPRGTKPRGPRAELPHIDPEFKAIVEGLDDYHRIDWPNNKDFSNGRKHLANQYTDNVVTNSTTQPNKHITQYLKLKVFELNTDGEGHAEKFLPSDIESVVKLIIKEKNIKVPNKLERCGVLYDMVNDLNVFPEIDLHDLTTDEKHWFKAMPMFLSMQREIEEYNLEWPHQHRSKRKKRKRKKSKKKREWCPKRKQMLDDPNFRPFIRIFAESTSNSTVQCSSMHRVLSSQKLLPKVEIENKNGKTRIINIPQKDFNDASDFWWDRYFGDVVAAKRTMDIAETSNSGGDQ
ncbi:uncharacterized protein LOC116351755 isoform X2 [Contarinia nasturtii]|uniref:uncharacterized protein LOC116351755 isoform X2 n=1 Tax=Contarinia nasturtii TaxID=265458 RepID=UPI0012D38793|nr:uncharacterized protein LOC116351755 isoform X2 [Contarinia nasturtii]